MKRNWVVFEGFLKERYEEKDHCFFLKVFLLDFSGPGRAKDQPGALTKFLHAVDWRDMEVGGRR